MYGIVIAPLKLINFISHAKHVPPKQQDCICEREKIRTRNIHHCRLLAQYEFAKQIRKTSVMESDGVEWIWVGEMRSKTSKEIQKWRKEMKEKWKNIPVIVICA